MTRATDVNGEIIPIEKSSNGKACGCLCIVCNTPLIARQGEFNSWHFAHDISTEYVDCSWSGETELHLKVKEYFLNLSTLNIPIGIHDPIMEMLEIDDVKVEIKYDDTRRIPDVTMLSNGEMILVEIGVTHFCDKTKINEYKSNNVNVLEVDFSKFETESDTISDTDIENYFRNNDSIFKWLSVAPAGYLGKRIHSHERKSLQKLNDDYKACQKKHSQEKTRLKNLEKEVIVEKRKLLLNCEETLEHTFNVDLSEDVNIKLLQNHYARLKSCLKADLFKTINYAKRDTELEVKMSTRFLLKNITNRHVKVNQTQLMELKCLLNDFLENVDCKST